MTSGLALVCLSLQLLFSPVANPPGAHVPSSVLRQDPASDGPFDWVKNLGSADWIIREESAEKLLDAGEEAVDALRSALSHSDLEVRERARELLSIISPLVIRMDVARLGKDANASLNTPFVSTLFKTLDFKSGETRLSTIQTDHEERRFQISLRGTEAPFSVEALFHGTSTSSMTGPPGQKIMPGVPWVILSEDRVRSETSMGMTTSQSENSTWILLMTEAHQAEDDHGDPETRLKDSLIRSLRNNPSTQQIVAAAMWEQIPDEEFTSDMSQRDSEALGDAWLVARLIRDLPGSREETEAIISLHLSGEEPMTAKRIDGLLPFAIEADLKGSAELLYQHCADLSPWSQHLLWSSLDQKIRNGAYSEPAMLKLLRSLTKPESLAVLRWSDSHMSSMWSSLIRNLNTNALNETFAENWSEIMGEDLSQSTGRIPLFFAALGFMTNKNVSLKPGWKDSMTELLPTQYAEYALSILLGQNRLIPLESEDWDRILEKLDRGLRMADTTISLRVRNSVKKLSQYDQLPSKHRQTFLTNLAVGLPEFQGNQRSIIEQVLTQNLGEVPRERNARKTDTYWEMRSKKWQERLESPIAVTPKEPRWIELTVADVRLEGQDVKPLTLRRWIMPTGRRLNMLGNDGKDSSIYLEDAAGGSVRFSGSILLMIDRPALTRWRTTWRNWTYRFSTARLGAESAMVRSSVMFQTLLIASEATAPEDGLTKELPVTWKDVDQFLIDSLDPDSSTNMYMATEVITTLRLHATIPRLVELWQEKPTVSLARALLALGDERGKELLRKTVMTSRSRLQRDTQKALEDLIKVGDREILESVIGWIEEPGSSSFSSNESQVLMLLRYLDSWLINNPEQKIIPDQRLIGALIRRTDNRNGRNTVIPMLRRQTGLDMGWWDTYSISDMEERYQVQEEVGSLWQTWWNKKSAEFEAGVKSDPPRDR